MEAPELSWSPVWVGPLVVLWASFAMMLGGSALPGSPLGRLLLLGAVALVLGTIGTATLRGRLRICWLLAWPIPLALFLTGVAASSSLDSAGTAALGSIALGLVAIAFTPGPWERRTGYAAAYAASCLPFLLLMSLCFFPCDSHGTCL